MITVLRRAVPRRVRLQYHKFLALAAMLWYRRPSRKLVVIGVTGTDGKTTTTNLIAHLLTSAGRSAGLSSSAMFQVGQRRWPNDSHLTMPGRFTLQRLLRQMVTAGCGYAVLEVSSEGLAQNRHVGTDFDIAVLTNLSPEHIEAHGSFEKYRHAKELLFGKIIKGGDKHIDGQTIRKVTVVNLDDEQAARFLSFWAEEHYGVTIDHPVAIPNRVEDKLHILRASNVTPGARQSTFTVGEQELRLPLPGKYNIYNALEAAAVGWAVGLSWDEIKTGLSSFEGVPGRGQEIPTGKPWRVIVDYALTPHALRELYAGLKQSGAQRIIAVFGAAGGGRDTWKRPELGKIAAEYCGHMILTTDDPYNENPNLIAQDIMSGVPVNQQGKVEIMIDRREAIKRAMQLAQVGDVIAITGMGSETSMMVKGRKVEWSDAETVKQLVAGNL